MGAAAPYLVNLKSNTMKNTWQIYQYFQFPANISRKKCINLSIFYIHNPLVNIYKH